MSSVDGRTPCIIGVAQRTVRPDEGPAPEPLVLWEQVCRAAAADSGGPPDKVLGAAGSLDVLYCQSWPYDDPPARLATRLGIDPRRQAYSGIGGTTPHRLLTGAAAAIARGQLDVAVVTGGEALDTLRRARRAGERPAWSHRSPDKRPFPFEAPFHPAEVAHEVFQAWLTFAVFEIARRARLGAAPAPYRQSLGELLAPMTRVAAANPHAWFRTPRSPEELITPRPDNRMVGYPYTKTMVAVMDVDMAAALVLASTEAADGLGIPAERRVYLRGAAEASDPVYVAEHDPMWASPAMAAASRSALAAAGAGIDDVSHFDLYSCFASSLGLACDALGLRSDDPRGLTVTGGLPFAGGPGSGYVLHSTAAMVDVLRRDPGSLGLVSGVGMHMTRHAFAVWSADPPPDARALDAGAPAGQERADGGAAGDPPPGPGRTIRATCTGPAIVAAYTVVHDRAGEPEWGLAVCDLPGGERAYARMEDPGLLRAVEETEWVGSTVRLVAGPDDVNRVAA